MEDRTLAGQSTNEINTWALCCKRLTRGIVTLEYFGTLVVVDEMSTLMLLSKSANRRNIQACMF
jgi:hypothetical protein